MANYLKLKDIKKHLNIDDYFTDDDLYIEALSNVAEKVVEKHIDLGLTIVADYNGGELPPPLIHAMLLFVGNMYANRESVAFASASEIPLSYQYILDLYKCYNPSNYSFAMNIIDNLTSNSTTDALSANQGRILKELIDSINVEVDLTNYYTKPQTDALMATKSEVTHTHVIGQVADLQAELDNKANVSDLPDVSQLMTESAADNKYQPKGSYLTSIPAEYMTETELNAKNYATTTQLEAKLDITAYNNDKATFAKKTEIPDTSDFVTTVQLNGKQDTLVSGTNIKTINGNSLLGEGDITIESPEGGITDAPKDGNTYARKDGSWEKITIQDTSDMLTKTEASNTYQTKGDYLTSIPAEYITDTELNEKGYATTTQLEAKLDITTYNNDKATFALKSEIPNTSDLATKSELTEGLAGKANTSDLSNYLTTTDAQSTYATKSELGAKLDTSTYNSDKATFALKSELPDTSDLVTKATADETYQPKGEYLTAVPDNYVTDEELNAKNYATTEQLNGKQDTLVSGTNIKTVNGNSLLGSGDITIEGGGIADAPNDNKLYARKNAQWSEISEATTSANGLMSSADKTKLDSIDVESILSRITALETQMGEVSAKLDAVNGEAV